MLNSEQLTAPVNTPDLLVDISWHGLAATPYCPSFEPTMARFLSEKTAPITELCLVGYKIPGDDSITIPINATVYFKKGKGLSDGGYYGEESGYMSIRVGDISYAFVVSKKPKGYQPGIDCLEIIRPAYMPTEWPCGDYSDTLAEYSTEIEERRALVEAIFRGIFDRNGNNPAEPVLQMQNYEKFQRGEAKFSNYNIRNHWTKIGQQLALERITNVLENCRPAGNTDGEADWSLGIEAILRTAEEYHLLDDESIRLQIAQQLSISVSRNSGPLSMSYKAVERMTDTLATNILGGCDSDNLRTKLALLEDMLEVGGIYNTTILIKTLMKHPLAATNFTLQGILAKACWDNHYSVDEAWELAMSNSQPPRLHNVGTQDKEDAISLYNTILNQFKMKLEHLDLDSSKQFTLATITGHLTNTQTRGNELAAFLTRNNTSCMTALQAQTRRRLAAIERGGKHNEGGNREEYLLLTEINEVLVKLLTPTWVDEG